MIHHPVFLRIYSSEGTTQFAVQNLFQNGTQTVGGVAYQFLDFSPGDLSAAQSADASTVTLSLPLLTSATFALEQGLAFGFLASLKVYRFEAATAPDALPGTQTTLVDYLGEVIDGSSDGVTLSIVLGSALAPIGAQVPPRRFTSALVGTPCRL